MSSNNNPKCIQIIMSAISPQFLPIVYTIEVDMISREHINILSSHNRGDWSKIPNNIKQFILLYVVSERGSKYQTVIPLKEDISLIGLQTFSHIQIIGQLYYYINLTK